MRKSSRVAAFAASAFIVAVLSAVPAAADVKLAYIDPLSGGAASAGINAQKHFIYLVDKINAAGGLNGEKLQIVFYDNKVDPQESLIALKKALDEGARYVFQGNGSAVALAISDAVLKYNERNPGKEVLYFNYAAVDPALTNAKCNFWHFRFDSDADMKMAALVTPDRLPAADQEGLSHQPGLFVRQGGRGRAHARCSPKSAPTSRSSATSCTRCRRSRTSRRMSPRSRHRARTP